MSYLKQKGYRMHMCSNGFHEVQYKKLASCGLRDFFDTIILSEDAGVNKPSPLYFDYALKVSGAKRQNTLMIGDNLNTDIKGALSAGIDALLFNRWQVNLSESTITPTYIAETLLDIKKVL
jgi:putative hydrolase of the HAD superfamily